MWVLKFHRRKEPVEHAACAHQPCLDLERSEFTCYKVGRVAVDSLRNGCPALRLSNC